MTFRRVLLMVTLLTPLLCGCAANLDLGMLYAAPGKYDYLRCEDLPARLATSIAREKQLTDLMKRANQDAGGPVVSAVAYSADLAQVRARERELAARRVVLLQAADRREQAAAFRVIEILGGYGLPGQGEPGDDILAKAFRRNHRTGKN